MDQRLRLQSHERFGSEPMDVGVFIFQGPYQGPGGTWARQLDERLCRLEADYLVLATQGSNERRDHALAQLHKLLARTGAATLRTLPGR